MKLLKCLALISLMSCGDKNSDSNDDAPTTGEVKPTPAPEPQPPKPKPPVPNPPPSKELNLTGEELQSFYSQIKDNTSTIKAENVLQKQYMMSGILLGKLNHDKINDKLALNIVRAFFENGKFNEHLSFDDFKTRINNFKN